MTKHPRRDMPPALAEQYDDYVVDAVALANGTLTPQREAEVRERMASDATYRAVVTPILEATRNPVPVSASEMDAQWADFRRRAALSSPDEDLAAFQERIRARERRFRRRIMFAAAVVAFVIAIPVVGLTYLRRTYFEQVETASNTTLTIEFPDGSVGTLAPSSKLEYRAGMQTPGGDLNREMTLDRGTADFAVRHVGAPAFAVRTPHAVMTVVGTRFRVEVHEGYTHVAVSEGVVRANALDEEGSRSGQPLLLEKGMGARVFRNGPVMVDKPAATSNPGTPR